jgi:hypothetical protein
MSEPSDPLPPIDFDADTRTSSASIHALGNAMEDDTAAPGAVSSLRDPDTGYIPTADPSASSTTPGPAPDAAPALAAPPPSEVKQLFDLIVSKMAPLEREVARIANIVDGKARHTPPTSTKPTRPRTEAPTAPAHRVSPSTPSVPRIDDDDTSFPALGSASGGPSPAGSYASRDSARAPAQVVSGSGPSRPRIGLSFASVVTDVAIGQQHQAAGHARLARDVQRRNPSGKPKPGHSAAPQGYTDVVVIRNGGSDDVEIEEAFRRRLPVDIAQAAQRALNALVRTPPSSSGAAGPKRWKNRVTSSSGLRGTSPPKSSVPTRLCCAVTSLLPSRPA